MTKPCVILCAGCSKANGYRVQCFSSAETFLDVYLPIAHSGAISCLILDVRMSGMTRARIAGATDRREFARCRSSS